MFVLSLKMLCVSATFSLLAPAAIEQKQTLYSFFKNRCASAQRLSPCGD